MGNNVERTMYTREAMTYGNLITFSNYLILKSQYQGFGKAPRSNVIE
jgi:hypothetical protein